jgi:hypothetical protein
MFMKVSDGLRFVPVFLSSVLVLFRNLMGDSGNQESIKGRKDEVNLELWNAGTEEVFLTECTQWAEWFRGEVYLRSFG